MARNQKLSYKMNMFHFLTKQNYSKYSQISMSMSFSSSEASTMFRSSTASSTSESVIFSKGLSLFLSSRTDNCDFSCWRPAWQGSFGLKQWILSSSDPSFARFSTHDLNDSTITSFERAAHDSSIHWTIFFLGGSFMLPTSVYWCAFSHPVIIFRTNELFERFVPTYVRLEYTLYILQEQSLDRSYLFWPLL